MLNSILQLDGVSRMTSNEQKTIHGGVGDWTIVCNSGARIANAPDSSDETMEFACRNQGGASAAICTGSNC